MAFVQIPLSNTLRMVRIDNQGSNLQNFDNRLLHQEDYPDYNDRPYFQKVSSSDTILIQYATDQTPVTAIVYDLNDAQVSNVTGSITQILESTSFNVYNLSFTIAQEGFYYLKINFGSSTEIYQSEYFQIDGYEAENMVKIEYNTSENDGIIYDNNETFIIRFEGRIVEFDPGQNKETYTNYNESKVNLNSYPIRVFELTYGAVPRYIAEKLNLALAHEVFKVNDVEYQSDEGNEAELLQEDVTVTNMYKGNVNLQQVTYEDYTTASDDVEPTINPILVDEFETVSFMQDQGTLFYNKYN